MSPKQQGEGFFWPKVTGVGGDHVATRTVFHTCILFMVCVCKICQEKKLSWELGICPACGKPPLWPSPLHLSCCHARGLSPQAFSAAGGNWDKKRYLSISSSHKQRPKSILKQPMGVESQSSAQGKGEGHLEPYGLSGFVACCASLELVTGLFIFSFFSSFSNSPACHHGVQPPFTGGC